MRNLKLLAALAALLLCCVLAVGCNSGSNTGTSADTTAANTEATSTTTETTVTDAENTVTTAEETTVADETTADGDTAGDTTEGDSAEDSTDGESVSTTGEEEITTEMEDTTTDANETTPVTNESTADTDETTTEEEETTTEKEEITNHPDASEGLVFAENPLKDSYTVIDIGTCTDTRVIIPAIHNGLPVVKIEARAFANEKNIFSVVIPDTVTYIGASAFDSCFKLANVTLSANLTTIADSAFADCSVLTAVVIPKKVTDIGVGVFAGCTGLTSIQVESGSNVYTSVGNCLIESEINKLIAGCKNSVIPEGVEIIEEDAFARSFSLTKINIPESVMKIGKNAFGGCVLLKTINYGGSEAQWNAIEKASGWDASVTGYSIICAKA